MPHKQSVKVVIRTRPTPNFATKNIQIDPINSVSFSFLFHFLACDHSHPKRCQWRFHQQSIRVLEV